MKGIVIGIVITVIAWIVIQSCCQLIWHEWEASACEPCPVPDESGEIIPDDEIPDPLIVPYDLHDYVEPEKPYCYMLVVTVNRAAQEYEIDVYWLWATLFVESHYNHFDDDWSLKRGSSGELGVGQIIPDGMKIKKRHDVTKLQGNVNCAAELLKFGLDERANGDKWRASGWYNTGDPVMNHYARTVRKVYTRLTAETADSTT